MASVISVVAGAKRFAHADWLRFDKALHSMLGMARFPGGDTVRNLFTHITQGAIEAFWRPLWRWLLPLFEMPAEGFSLDLDSTVFQRSGHQQGAAKGYNPKRPDRKTHHPLLAVLGEAQCVLHAWLRSANTSASRGVSHFLLEALALLAEHWKIRCLRAFARELFEFLEQRAIPYVVVARLTNSLKRLATGIGDWREVDKDYAVGEYFAQLQGWDRKRRFLVIRERVRESKEAVGRKLLDVPGYTFRIFVTNREGEALELWRDYNRRAVVEQRIEEIKAEMHADGFCMRDFYARESAFLAVLFTFNLLSLSQKVTGPKARYRQPATLRAAVFLEGAVMGRCARKPVLLISRAWGAIQKHISLIESLLKWENTASPKLHSNPQNTNASLATQGTAD